MTVLETNKLTKKYRRITALDGLDLAIEPGMVFGMLGPNGSGKTTTLGLVLDVLQATSGSYRWFGQEPSAEIRRQIGAILETPCFYPYMTGWQNLQVVSRIKQCPESTIDGVLELVGLLQRKNDDFKTYSLGMKQRLAIASALLADPKVLILDEPTNGLDPMGIFEIRQLIKQIAATGKTIILASHLLDEVQKVCTHFMVLQRGIKLYQGSVDEALGDQRTIEISAENMDQLGTLLTSWEDLGKIERRDSHFVVTPSNGVTTGKINEYLHQNALTLTHLVEKGGDLEQQFLKILAEHD